MNEQMQQPIIVMPGQPGNGQGQQPGQVIYYPQPGPYQQPGQYPIFNPYQQPPIYMMPMPQPPPQQSAQPPKVPPTTPKQDNSGDYFVYGLITFIIMALATLAQ